jgi:hypothetical protein
MYEFQAHSSAGVLAVEVLDGGNMTIVTQGRDSFVKIWQLQSDSVLLLSAIMSKSHTFCKLAVQRWPQSEVDHEGYIADLQKSSSGSFACDTPPQASGEATIFEATSGPPMLAAIPSEEEAIVCLFDLRTLTFVKPLPLTDDDASGATKRGMCMCMALFRAHSSIGGVYIAVGV